MSEDFATMYGNTGKDKARVRAGKMPIDTSLGRASNRYNADFVRDVIKPDNEDYKRKSSVAKGRSTADSYANNNRNNAKASDKRQAEFAKAKALKEKLNKMLERKKAK
jgi:hypothetical protein